MVEKKETTKKKTTKIMKKVIFKKYSPILDQVVEAGSKDERIEKVTQLLSDKIN